MKNLTLLSLLFSGLISYSSYSKGLEDPAVYGYVPKNFTVIDEYKADLNQDGMDDAILVLSDKREKAASPSADIHRLLIILLKTKDGFEKIVESNKVVLCKACGGMMGDPYVGITIKAPYFTVEQAGGAMDRWMQYITFKYSKEQHTFFLHKLGYQFFQAINPGESTEKIQTFKDFGVVKIQHFDAYKD